MVNFIRYILKPSQHDNILTVLTRELLTTVNGLQYQNLQRKMCVEKKRLNHT